MIKMIGSEIRNDGRNTLTDVLLYTISMSTLAISMVLMFCGIHIRKSNWYHGVEEAARAGGDTMIQDKGDILVTILSVICIVVWVFVLCGMFLFIRHSVEREFHGNSVLEAMGYHNRTIMGMNAVKQLVFVTLAWIPSLGLEMLLWFMIRKNAVFASMLLYADTNIKDVACALMLSYVVICVYSALITMLAGRKESKKTLKTRMQQER